MQQMCWTTEMSRFEGIIVLSIAIHLGKRFNRIPNRYISKQYLNIDVLAHGEVWSRPAKKCLIRATFEHQQLKHGYLYSNTDRNQISWRLENLTFFSPVMFRVKQPELHESSCKPCPAAASSPVCGSDGHNYASEVKTFITCSKFPL